MTLIPLLPDSLFPLLGVFSVSLAVCTCLPQHCVHASRACLGAACVTCVTRVTHTCLGSACVTCLPRRRVRASRACLGAVCVMCLPWCHTHHVPASALCASVPCVSRACVPASALHASRASRACLGATCVTCVMGVSRPCMRHVRHVRASAHGGGSAPSCKRLLGRPD